MTDDEERAEEVEQYRAVPEEVPAPSYAPIFTALGIALAGWGLLTNGLVTLLGLGFFLFGASIWTKELIR